VVTDILVQAVTGGGLRAVLIADALALTAVALMLLSIRRQNQ